jgi:DNA repair protein RadB
MVEEDRQDARNKISAGNYDLNRWLFGGYDRDIITTIYGPAGSGKTNFCLMACVSMAKKGKKVIFIDTEGGFSIERFRQLCNFKEGEDFREVLENVLILKPTNFEEQWKAFSELLKELREDRESKIGLIVVDGMTMLYRLELAEARKEEDEKERYNKIDEINSKLARQMRLLSEIARKRNIPVIVSNQVYSEFLTDEQIEAGKQREVFMVGGDILKYWSKCILELKNERGKRSLILRKHRSLGEKKLDFEIFDLGIRKRGWL